MAHAREVMEMEVNPEHKHFARILAAKQSMAASILTATARVRDGLLRPAGDDDGLGVILARIKSGSDIASARRSIRSLDIEAEVASDERLIPVLAGKEGIITADDLFN